MSGQENRGLGRWGEELAAGHLKRAGYRILERNWSCRFGEIDLIAADRTCLCFVEVKLRKNERCGRAAEFVDWRKQQRLRTAAQLYLTVHPTDLQPRFDVIEIYAPGGMDAAQASLNHLENAF